MMLDASRPLDEEDMEILDFIEDKKAIIIVNKTDIDKKIDFDTLCNYTEKENIIYTSVKEDKGIDVRFK